MFAIPARRRYRLTLDRESIERKDFPAAQHGYDRSAVDAHLSALARQVEELNRDARHSRAETVATAVSEQVRGIVEAAENSAAEILRSAELEAQEVRAQASHAAEQASGEAQHRRELAATQARDYVGRVSNSISQLLGRLEAMDGELNTLTTSLRNDTERLRGELGALELELEGAITGSESAAPEPVSEPPEAAPPIGFGEPAPIPADVTEPAPPPFDVTEPAPPPADLSDPQAQYSPEAAPAAGSDISDDSEAARLIALNMALNGTPREETDRYLAENYDLAGRERLLDEVYSSVQG